MYREPMDKANGRGWVGLSVGGGGGWGRGKWWVENGDDYS